MNRGDKLITYVGLPLLLVAFVSLLLAFSTCFPQPNSIPSTRLFPVGTKVFAQLDEGFVGSPRIIEGVVTGHLNSAHIVKDELTGESFKVWLSYMKERK